LFNNFSSHIVEETGRIGGLKEQNLKSNSSVQGVEEGLGNNSTGCFNHWRGRGRQFQIEIHEKQIGIYLVIITIQGKVRGKILDRGWSELPRPSQVIFPGCPP